MYEWEEEEVCLCLSLWHIHKVARCYWYCYVDRWCPCLCVVGGLRRDCFYAFKNSNIIDSFCFSGESENSFHGHTQDQWRLQMKEIAFSMKVGENRSQWIKLPHSKTIPLPLTARGIKSFWSVLWVNLLSSSSIHYFFSSTSSSLSKDKLWTITHKSKELLETFDSTQPRTLKAVVYLSTNTHFGSHWLELCLNWTGAWWVIPPRPQNNHFYCVW